MAAPLTPAAPGRPLTYLDGLRGLAALVVVAHHFAGFFYPTLLSGNPGTAHLGAGVESVLARSPLNLLIGGNFAVCLFFVLSGLVLSENFWQAGRAEVLYSQACRRYVRLMLPVTVAAVVALLLWAADAYRNTELAAVTGAARFGEFWGPLPGLKQIVHDLAVGIPLSGESSYNPVFWTLTLELFGSFLVFALLALFGHLRHRPVIYAVAILLLSGSGLNFYYVGFILGVWLNDRRHQRGVQFPMAPGAATVLLLAAVVAGSYPSPDLLPVESSFYDWLRPAWVGVERAQQFWHLVGAVLLLLAVLRLPRLQRVLSSRGLRKLGAMSFSLYLLHFPVLGSFASTVFLRLYPHLSYHASAALTALATLPVLALTSYAMYRLVDKSGIRLAQWLYDRFFRPTPAG
ncbi:acyltransferase family protein [Hymenobacter persicinus]|uniref:Acyltransferase n=1 Tax=Hymenobacter persicinus TaxID=2025506 RepID=A0A4Q5L9J1_9BACT|nr:acyltransferase [Hymenobacter persicinus]RYU77709.1 acyltransferase [Hymenobacter persicinus]